MQSGSLAHAEPADFASVHALHFPVAVGSGFSQALLEPIDLRLQGQEFLELASSSAFGSADIEADEIGFEVTLEKRADPVISNA